VEVRIDEGAEASRLDAVLAEMLLGRARAIVARTDNLGLDDPQPPHLLNRRMPAFS
jgi:hypothetical protein